MLSIAIVGILSSLAIPSFINWRRYEQVKGYQRKIYGEIEGISTESRRWSATCTISIITTKNKTPLSINCRADGSEKSRDLCNSNTNCNLSSRQLLLTEMPKDIRGRSLVWLRSNRKTFTYTPRGMLSSPTDIVFVIGHHHSRSLKECIAIKKITGRLITGTYRRSISSQPSSTAVSIDSGLNANNCV